MQQSLFSDAALLAAAGNAAALLRQGFTDTGYFAPFPLVLKDGTKKVSLAATRV